MFNIITFITLESNNNILYDKNSKIKNKIKTNKSSNNISQENIINNNDTKNNISDDENSYSSSNIKIIKTNKSPKNISQEIINNDSNDTKNNIWKHIFQEIKYNGDKDIIITAEQIKKSNKNWKGVNNQFEPRLLCKQDSNKDRPQIFKDYNIYIISVKNGEYLLTKNSIYFNLEYPKIKIIEIKQNDDSLLLSIGNSETSLIDNLRYSGLFEKILYLGEKILFGSLLNGRHRCSFKTKIGNKDIDICGSQYETDACYESENKILLIEGKSVNNIDSLNIRQLYYPYRTIFDKVGNKKEIITLFINKDKNNHIHIWKFQFDNPLELTSIKNTAYHKYEFD